MKNNKNTREQGLTAQNNVGETSESGTLEYCPNCNHELPVNNIKASGVPCLVEDSMAGKCGKSSIVDKIKNAYCYAKPILKAVLTVVDVLIFLLIIAVVLYYAFSKLPTIGVAFETMNKVAPNTLLSFGGDPRDFYIEKFWGAASSFFTWLSLSILSVHFIGKIDQTKLGDFWIGFLATVKWLVVTLSLFGFWSLLFWVSLGCAIYLKHFINVGTGLVPFSTLEK